MTDQQKQRRAEVARENGKKSRGPVTIAGKYRSSMNAIATGKHIEVHDQDLPAFAAVLAIDDRREYVRMFQANLRKFRPDSEHEHFLVRHLTAELFQYERTSHIENQAMQLELDTVLREFPDLEADEHLLQSYKRFLTQEKLLRSLERKKKAHLAAYEKFLRILAKTRKEFSLLPAEPVDMTADNQIIELPLPTPEVVAEMLAQADQAKKEPNFPLPRYVINFLKNKQVMQKVAPRYDLGNLLDRYGSEVA